MTHVDLMTYKMLWFTNGNPFLLHFGGSSKFMTKEWLIHESATLIKKKFKWIESAFIHDGKIIEKKMLIYQHKYLTGLNTKFHRSVKM